MKLKSTVNMPAVAAEIDAAFLAGGPAPCSQHGQLDFEHGHWWVTCSMCGAQWDAVDVSPTGFDFEQVTQGDGHEDDD